MSDPCGIVDTIQSNLPAMDSVAASACLGAVDTTNGAAALTQGEDGERDINEAPSDERAFIGEEKKDDSSAKSGDTTGSKTKKKGGLLRRWTSKILDEEPADTEEKEEEPPKIDPISDLSDPSRKICVVTTAALPWRTGTAVNPLARALYLTRGRPKNSVTLMIPWLTDQEDQAKVYGNNIFETPEEQEEWIRQYCRERIFNSETNDDSNDEVENLQIRFYPSSYHNLGRSIFASVDICALIPEDEADIAILEEPEHLTWFRTLPPSNSPPGSPSSTSIMDAVLDSDSVCGTSLAKGIVDEGNSEDGKDAKENDEAAEELKKKLEEQAVIGWTSKFNYVVGILHTNYSAYMRQYGLWSSFLTSNALQALSSLVVKAYTHKLIRLSDTLPELDKSKEVTCNVHGVRPEFFVVEQEQQTPAQPVPDVAATEDDVPKPETTDDEATEQMTVSDATSDTIEAEEAFQPEPVYFIGKVIWAKGFDKMLEIQDLYRKETGEYFPIDVYGSGGDFEAISRAFLGRSGLAKRVTSSGSVKSLVSQSSESDSPAPSPKDLAAASLFSKEGNLRGQIDEIQTKGSNDLVVEVKASDSPENDGAVTPTSSSANYPKQIIDQLGEKTKETGAGVTKAINKLSEKLSNIGFRSLYTEEGDESEGSNDDNATTDTGSTLASKFRFDPPKSRYELRRHAIPARFLGSKDHALLRDIPGHKIFVNLSITEVLCTTTAEALAMGKFVVIPEHRKFFPVFIILELSVLYCIPLSCRWWYSHNNFFFQ